MSGTVYTTRGLREPAPYGLLQADDSVNIESSTGLVFRMNAVELERLCEQLRSACWEEGSVPPLVLVRWWNEDTGFLADDRTRSIIDDLPQTAAALHAISASYLRSLVYGDLGLGAADFMALVRFLDDAVAQDAMVSVWKN